MAEQDLDSYERMVQMIQQMPEGSPEREELITNLTLNYPGMDADIQDRLSQATAMESTAMPEGRMVGDRFVASNPLEVMSAALRQGAGSYARRKAQDSKKDLNKKQSDALQQMLAAGLRKKQQAAVAQQAIQQAAPVMNQVKRQPPPQPMAAPQLAAQPAPQQPQPQPRMAAAPPQQPIAAAPVRQQGIPLRNTQGYKQPASPMMQLAQAAQLRELQKRKPRASSDNVNIDELLGGNFP